MSNYDYANSLLRQERFEEAISYFYNSLARDNLSETQKRNCYKSLIHIYSTRSQKSFLKNVQLEYADFLKSSGRFYEAIEIFEAFRGQKDQNDPVYYKLWQCYSFCGEVAKASDCSQKYLKYLLSNKKVGLGKSFLKEIKRIGAGIEHYNYYDLCFSILIWDIDSIDKGVDALLSSWPLKWPDCSLLEDICSLIETQQLPWKRSPQLFELKLIKILMQLKKKEEGEKNGPLSRDFLALLFEYITLFSKRLSGYYIGLDYGLTCKRKQLSEKFITYYNSQKLNFVREKKFVSLFENNVSIVSEMSESDADIEYRDSNYPKVSHLNLIKDISAVRSKEKVAREVQRRIGELTRDIKFLLGQNKNLEAMGIVRKLAMIDPDNPELAEYKKAIKKSHETTDSLDKAALKITKRNVDDIQRELMREISKYTVEEDSPPDEGMVKEKWIIKEIEYLGKENLNQFYSDLVITFLTMDLNTVALKILDIVENDILESDNIGEKLNFSYLKTMTLFRKNKLHDALLLVKGILTGRPLLEEEKKCFMYLKGEILKKQGKRREALSVFNSVYRMDPNYRLISQRLNELE